MPAQPRFFSWPEFGEMLGGRFDEHPWGISEATVIVEDRTSPISRHLPATFAVTDEHYQLKDFSRKNVHVLARLDPAKLDLKAPLVHRTDGDFAVAYTREYGRAASSIRRLAIHENSGTPRGSRRCISKP
jgi:type 1 glutamine amidotransferase